MHSSRRFQCNTSLPFEQERTEQRKEATSTSKLNRLTSVDALRGAGRIADSSLMRRRNGNRVGARSNPAERTAIVPSETVARLLIRPCR